MRALALAILLALAALLAACKKPAPTPTREPVPLPAVGEFLPPSLDVPDYVGAAACAECHRGVYDAWQRSPHGRSMAVASPDTVLAGFGGPPVTLADGSVSFSREGDDFFMDLASRGGHERRKVDLVLASGRQHQLYVARGADGGFALLPVIWGTKVKEWMPLSLYQGADLDPSSPKYWGAQDMTKGCVSCHLSQAYRHVGPDGVRSAYVDLSINCEACHGAGAEHVRRRRAGRTDEVYRDLSKLGSVEESRVCGGCHGFQLKPYVFPPADDKLPQIFVMSLLNDTLRADGTQHLTSYQYPAHVLSAGFRERRCDARTAMRRTGSTARSKQGSRPRARNRTSSAPPVTKSWSHPSRWRPTRTIRPPCAASTATWRTRGSATMTVATSAPRITRSRSRIRRRPSPSARPTPVRLATRTGRPPGRSMRSGSGRPRTRSASANGSRPSRWLARRLRAPREPGSGAVA